jgi:hypothetical protein
MKKCALLLTTVLFATALFAAGKNSSTVVLRQAVTVGSSTLPAGEYKVTWTDPGADSKVTFAQGKTTVATIPATVVAQENPTVSVLTATEGSTTVLNGLHLKTVNVTFGSNSKTSQ